MHKTSRIFPFQAEAVAIKTCQFGFKYPTKELCRFNKTTSMQNPEKRHHTAQLKKLKNLDFLLNERETLKCSN